MFLVIKQHNKNKHNKHKTKLNLRKEENSKTKQIKARATNINLNNNKKAEGIKKIYSKNCLIKLIYSIRSTSNRSVDVA